MCGIAGLVGVGDGAAHIPSVERALHRLAHRGPDDHGLTVFPASDTASGPFAILGNRRLSIIDLTAAGHQPMATPDGRWVLVANGEIYNHVEIRQELTRQGHEFRSCCDTEVLLHGLALDGPEFLGRLVGMFAFALLDTRRRRVLLARDHFGIKPLYYAASAGGVAFASEATALFEFPGVSRRVNPTRLHRYVADGNTDFGEETLFADIRQLPPGHYMEIALDDPSRIVPVPYWELDLDRSCELSFSSAAERLRALFVENVRLHLRSDVPYGIALSGGLDSSAVAMVARDVVGSGTDLHTIHYDPADAAMREAHFAGVVSRAAETRHCEFRVSAERLPQKLEEVLSAQGEPFATSVVFIQAELFARAQEAGLKVLLTGEGADELFGGYGWHIPARLASLCRRGRWLQAWRLLRRTAATPGRRLGLVKGTGRLLWPAAGRAARWLRTAQAGMPWLDTSWFAEREAVPSAPPNLRGHDMLRRTLRDSVVHFFLPALLRYQDRNAMAVGVENRVPFLTRELAEFVFSLPEEYLLAPDGTQKAVLKAALEGLVPAQVLSRRTKIGFSMPLAAWLARLEPWVASTLRAARAAPGFDLRDIENRWGLVRRAQGSARDVLVVWRCLCLTTWAGVCQVDFD